MIGRSVRRYFSTTLAFRQRPTKLIENLLKENGPQTVNNCWKLAEPAGIKSKTHMKTMLHWLVERKRVQITCNHVKHSGQKAATQTKGGKQLKSGQGFKEFLFGIRPKRTKSQEGNAEDLAKLDGTSDSANTEETNDGGELDENEEETQKDQKPVGKETV